MGKHSKKNFSRSNNPRPATTEERSKSAQSGGHWYHPHQWSEASRQLYLLTQTLQQHDPRKVRKMVTESVIKTLTGELCLEALPQPSADQMRRDQVQLGMTVRKIGRLLDRFGNLNVVFSANGELPWSLDGAIKIGGKACLTSDHITMPLREFIYYLNGKHTSEVAEWSGVPEAELESVYRDIVTFLWWELKKEPASEEEKSVVLKMGECGVHFHAECGVVNVYTGTTVNTTTALEATAD